MKYFKDDGTPIKCSNCGSELIKVKIIDMIDSIVLEKEYYCVSCSTTLAYWAFGYFDTRE